MAKIKKKIKHSKGGSEPVSPEVKEAEVEQSMAFAKLVGGLFIVIALFFIVLHFSN